ncbi:MAG: hypothetical protein AAF938_20735 [Myxococcota bacterium]
MRLPEVYVVFANEWRGVIRCANDAQELDRSFAERLGSGSVALAGSTLRALMLPGLVLFLVGWTFGLIGLATTELAILNQASFASNAGRTMRQDCCAKAAY